MRRSVRLNLLTGHSERVREDFQRLAVGFPHFAALDPRHRLRRHAGEDALRQPALHSQPSEGRPETLLRFPPLRVQLLAVLRIGLVQDRVAGGFVLAERDRPAVAVTRGREKSGRWPSPEGWKRENGTTTAVRSARRSVTVCVPVSVATATNSSDRNSLVARSAGTSSSAGSQRYLAVSPRTNRASMFMSVMLGRMRNGRGTLAGGSVPSLLRSRTRLSVRIARRQPPAFYHWSSPFTPPSSPSSLPRRSPAPRRR